MASLNRPTRPAPVFTAQGAKAVNINAEAQLRRSVMACMLWEGTFYESGESIGDRIKGLIQQVSPFRCTQIAIDAREKQKLRHVPLLIAREMARLPEHKKFVADLLERIIQRPDELTEFLAIYWDEREEKGRPNPRMRAKKVTHERKKRAPLSKQVRKGLARAIIKFNEYSLGKYNRDGAVKLKDVVFLTHPKPNAPLGPERSVNRKYKQPAADGVSHVVATKLLPRHDESLIGKIVNDKLQVPDTWEVALSGGADKKETFERLMSEGKLGALAFIRNLRNMQQAGVDAGQIAQYAVTVPTERVLPFRFISAARAVPAWESMIEGMMLRCLEGQEKIPGRTIIVVDNSGSMHNTKVSSNSDIDRSDAACALAILLREICEKCRIVVFSDNAVEAPARRGFALADAIKNATHHGGTNTDYALASTEGIGYDRIIVITDEQSHQRIRGPLKSARAYFVNVSVEKNGIGYGAWTHIDGWSEAIIDYIRAYEGEVFEEDS